MWLRAGRTESRAERDRLLQACYVSGTSVSRGGAQVYFLMHAAGRWMCLYIPHLDDSKDRACNGFGTETERDTTKCNRKVMLMGHHELRGKIPRTRHEPGNARSCRSDTGVRLRPFRLFDDRNARRSDGGDRDGPESVRTAARRASQP